MSKRQIRLSDAVTVVVENQVASGRYADFSSALQDAAWHFFIGPPSPFDEYGLTAVQPGDLMAERKHRSPAS